MKKKGIRQKKIYPQKKLRTLLTADKSNKANFIIIHFSVWEIVNPCGNGSERNRQTWSVFGLVILFSFSRVSVNIMKALITGASSGIGRDIARYLSSLGCSLILVARREGRLEELKNELKTPVRIITCDISKAENCYDLYQKTKGENIDILINNAGFGIYGAFTKTPLEEELRLIKTNIEAVHILTKLFLRDFRKRDKGYILNVSSSAAFLPGPLLSSYYASKSYVLRLSEAVYEELRREKSNVSISVLCPGPVRTEFDEVANVKFSINGLPSEYVARCAVNGMLNRRLIIIPGTIMKLARLGERFLSEKAALKVSYHMQSRKSGRDLNGQK